MQWKGKETWETPSSQVANTKSVQLSSPSFFKKYIFSRFPGSQQLSFELQQQIKLNLPKGNLRIKENWHLSWFKNVWNDSSGKKICGNKWGLSKTSGVCKQWDKVIRKQKQRFSQLWKPIYSTGCGSCSLPYSLYPLCFWGTRGYTTIRVQSEKRKNSRCPKLVLPHKENKIKSIYVLFLTQS